MDLQLFSKLLTLFLVTQALGMIVAVDLLDKINSGELEQPRIVTENPGDVENAVGLFAYIILFTIIILIIIKFVKGILLFRILEAIAIFASSFLVFNVFLSEAAVMLAVLLVLLRNALRDSIFLRNISGIIAVAGAGALTGISLGITPVIVFVVMLAIYDIIAVFWTKHMVVMAKHLTKSNLAFTYALPTKQHQFELGTGDIVIPLAFSTSVLREGFSLGFPNYLWLPLMILLGSIIGLVATIEYASKSPGKALPALPLQTGIMIAMLAIGKFFGL